MACDDDYKERKDCALSTQGESSGGERISGGEVAAKGRMTRLAART